VALTFAVDDAPAAVESPAPIFASPALVDEATELVSSGLRILDGDDQKVMGAVASRQLHDGVRNAVDRLMMAFSERRPRGPLADYRRAIALNYAMNYGDRFAPPRSSHGHN
jgi:hypothetical protein